MSTRLHKVQDLLHKEIASLILSNINNPIISKSVTVSGVKVSKDSAIVKYILQLSMKIY